MSALMERYAVARLRSSFHSGTSGLDFDRRKLGPAYSWCGDGAIRIGGGNLDSREFAVAAGSELGEVTVRLMSGGAEAGRCRLQYSACDSTVRLSDVFVREDLRRGGLASLMVRFGFRLALDNLTGARCSIRLPHINGHWTEDKSIGAAGICLIARSLGFAPEYNIEALVRIDNITGIRRTEGRDAFPPAYRLSLRSFPSVMLVLLTERDGRTLCAGDHWIHDFPTAPGTMEHWACAGQLLALNGDYILRRDGIEQMVNHVAESEVEAREMRLKLHAVGSAGGLR